MQKRHDGKDLITTLKASLKAKDVRWGCTIFAQMAEMDMLGSHLFLTTELVDMCAKCGSLESAQEVFDKLPIRTVVSWNALIAGYAKHGLGEKVLDCLEQMKVEGLSPDAITYTCNLKACGSIDAPARGIEIHAEIVRLELLRSDRVLGAAIVDMYAKCGFHEKAVEIFGELPQRNVGTWNAVIAAYTRQQFGKEAIICFRQMKHESVLPNSITYICILRAFCFMDWKDIGKHMHTEITAKLLIDESVSCSLITMYAESGLFDQAVKVFEEIQYQNVTLWNIMMSVYNKHSLFEEVLECFKRLQLEGEPPDYITLACCIRACGSSRALQTGKALHAMTIDQFHQKEPIICNALIDMYGKCGFLFEACKVFKNIPDKDLSSWNTLINGYLDHGCYVEVLGCFEQMKYNCVEADSVTFSCAVKACNNIGAIDKGMEMHADIKRKGFLESDLVIGNTLIDMYVKHGFLAQAQDVFENLPKQDIISWNTLIVGYSKFDQHAKVLYCFEQMRFHDIYPDAASFACAMKACGNLGYIDKGRQMHSEMEMKGLLETDLTVGIALIVMYGKCGMLEESEEVFMNLGSGDAVLWNAMIARYVDHEQGEEALLFFEQMQDEGLSPNAVTFCCSLKACGSLKDLVKGKKIHCDVARAGILESSLVVGNALVDMYCKCGQLQKAEEAFNKLSRQDVVSWNTIIAGCVKHEFNFEALKHLQKMQQEGFEPDAFTFSCCLKACGAIGALEKGIELHNEIKKTGLSKNYCVGVALVEMYGKCGCLDKAQDIFNQLPSKNVTVWNTLISGFWDQEAVLRCFDQMEQEGVCPDAVTYVFSFSACGNLGLLEKGSKLHMKIGRQSLLGREITIGNTLVDMYTRLGCISKAHEIFVELPKRDLVSWNNLISGYAQSGETTNVMNLFHQMRNGGEEPDSVTFVGILNACNHAGLVDEAHACFNAISDAYGITPTLEHCSCVIDLLGRAGQLEKTLIMMVRLPLQPNILMWCIILAGCRKWGNVELAGIVFKQAMQLDKNEVFTHVAMYNTYADINMQCYSW